MATVGMVYAPPGMGKTSSLRNFTNDQVAVFSVSGKRFPFKSDLKMAVSDSYEAIARTLPKIEQKTIVIDDATYLMVHEFMRNAKVNGYQKYTDIGKNFYDLIQAAKALPDDKTVWFLGHMETMEDGREHFKTIGKMLDNYVSLEGEFEIVLKAVVRDGKYYFSTHNTGSDTVRTPFGMFEDDYIDNDLAMVDKVIREYWDMPENPPKKESKK